MVLVYLVVVWSVCRSSVPVARLPSVVAAAGALLAATAAADAGGARQRRLRSARAQPAGAEVRWTSSHLV